MSGNGNPSSASSPPAAQQQVDERDRLVEKILQWIETQEHINARTDREWLLRFLRGCKYDLEKTRRKITNFYTIRAKAPEWFKNRDPFLPEIQALLSLGVFLPLHFRDSEGRLVVIIRAAVHNPDIHLQSDVFKVGKMVLDVVLEQDESIAVHGVVAIIDLSGVTLKHAMQLTPAVIKKAVHTWQDCYPVKPKRLDFVNAPVYVNVILNIFRKFMKDKMKRRVYVHGSNLSNLHKEIPKDIIPEEYGGSNGNVSELAVYWKAQAEQNRDWFREDEKYIADIQ